MADRMTPFGVVPRWHPYSDSESMPPGMLFRREDEPEKVFLVGSVNQGGGVCGCCGGPWPYEVPEGHPRWEVSSMLLDHGLRVEVVK